MRPWFTLTIIAIIAGCLLSFWLVVDFVLLNRLMFETPFNIMVRLPFPPWSHRWPEVQFMYILTVSVLLGAGIVALTTLIFDTKRALKVHRMRKELARLQKALEEAQAKLPAPLVPDRVDKDDVSAEESAEDTPLLFEPEPADDGTAVTPEDITHSFKNVVEQGNFLKAAQKRVEDELERHAGRRPEGDIRTIVTGASDESATASEPGEDAPNSNAEPEHSAVEKAESNQNEQSISEAQQEGSSEEEIVKPPYAVDDDADQEERTVSESPLEDIVVQDVAATDEPVEDDAKPEEAAGIAEQGNDNRNADERDDAQNIPDEQKQTSAIEATMVEDDDANPSEENPDDVSPEGTEPLKKASSEHDE